MEDRSRQTGLSKIAVQVIGISLIFNVTSENPIDVKAQGDSLKGPPGIPDLPCLTCSVVAWPQTPICDFLVMLEYACGHINIHKGRVQILTRRLKGSVPGKEVVCM